MKKQFMPALHYIYHGSALHRGRLLPISSSERNTAPDGSRSPSEKRRTSEC